jgi:hypothetical protein
MTGEPYEQYGVGTGAALVVWCLLDMHSDKCPPFVECLQASKAAAPDRSGAIEPAGAVRLSSCGGTRRVQKLIGAQVEGFQAVGSEIGKEDEG